MIIAGVPPLRAFSSWGLEEGLETRVGILIAGPRNNLCSVVSGFQAITNKQRCLLAHLGIK